MNVSRRMKDRALLSCILLVSATARADDAISAARLRAHIRFLAADLLEGRGPGSRGDHLAQRYIQCELEALGLKPGAPGGGWLQPVPLLGVDTKTPGFISFRRGA